MAAKRGAPPGNKNAKRQAGIWTDAIRWALAQQGPEGQKRLRRAALALVTEAEAGNVAALKEIGDRLEGKAVQPIVGANDHPPLQHAVEITIVDVKD